MVLKATGAPIENQVMRSMSEEIKQLQSSFEQINSEWLLVETSRSYSSL